AANAIRMSAPAESRGDMGQDRFDDMGVVIDAELVRNGEQKRVGLGDGFVSPQFLDKLVRLGGVAPSEDRPRILVDEADLVGAFVASAEIHAVTVVDQREDTAAHRYARLAFVAGGLPGLAEGPDLDSL